MLHANKRHAESAGPALDPTLLWDEFRDTASQLESWLRTVTTSSYTYNGGAPHGQTPGRHVLDHVDALLAALANPEVTPIDYEQRRRDQRLETEPQKALSHLRSQCAELESHCGGDEDPNLQMAYRTEQGHVHLNSTLSRELIFLTEHSIHHMAMIELLLHDQGLALPEEFGVNPSTLRHEASQRHHAG